MSRSIYLDFLKQRKLVLKACSHFSKEGDLSVFKTLCLPELGLIDTFTKNIAELKDSGSLLALLSMGFDVNYKPFDKENMAILYIEESLNSIKSNEKPLFGQGSFGDVLDKHGFYFESEEEWFYRPFFVYMNNIPDTDDFSNYLEDIEFLEKRSSKGFDDKNTRDYLRSLFYRAKSNLAFSQLIRFFNENKVPLPKKIGESPFYYYFDSKNLLSDERIFLNDIKYFIDNYGLDINSECFSNECHFFQDLIRRNVDLSIKALPGLIKLGLDVKKPYFDGYSIEYSINNSSEDELKDVLEMSLRKIDKDNNIEDSQLTMM